MLLQKKKQLKKKLKLVRLNDTGITYIHIIKFFETATCALQKSVIL